MFNYEMKSPRSNGLVVRAVACEARGPGFDSSSDQKVFSLLGYKVVGIKMDPDMINCMILRIHVEKKKFCTNGPDLIKKY